MKWESPVMYGRPDNVLISQWLPQEDILAHPNTLLFISHCGFGSITEAKYHRVPIIAIPVFGDQSKNAAQVVEEGWGVQIELVPFSEKALQDAITEILTKPK